MPGASSYDYFMFFIVINYIIFVLSFSHYVRINQTVNFKGSRGPQGDKGDSGENVECNICQAKPQLLKRPYTQNIESEVLMPDLSEFITKENSEPQVFDPPQELGLTANNIKNALKHKIKNKTN